MADQTDTGQLQQLGAELEKANRQFERLVGSAEKLRGAQFGPTLVAAKGPLLETAEAFKAVNERMTAYNTRAAKIVEGGTALTNTLVTQAMAVRKLADAWSAVATAQAAVRAAPPPTGVRLTYPAAGGAAPAGAVAAPGGSGGSAGGAAGAAAPAPPPPPWFLAYQSQLNDLKSQIGSQIHGSGGVAADDRQALLRDVQAFRSRVGNEAFTRYLNNDLQPGDMARYGTLSGGASRLTSGLHGLTGQPMDTVSDLRDRALQMARSVDNLGGAIPLARRQAMQANIGNLLGEVTMTQRRGRANGIDPSESQILRQIQAVLQNSRSDLAGVGVFSDPRVQNLMSGAGAARNRFDGLVGSGGPVDRTTGKALKDEADQLDRQARILERILSYRKELSDEDRQRIRGVRAEAAEMHADRDLVPVKTSMREKLGDVMNMGIGGGLGRFGRGLLPLLGFGTIGVGLAGLARGIDTTVDQGADVENLLRRGAGAHGDGAAFDRDGLRSALFGEIGGLGISRGEGLRTAHALAAAGGAPNLVGSDRLRPLLQFSRYMGADLNESTSAFATLERTGAIHTGNQNIGPGTVNSGQMARLMAQAIRDGGMSGRESEVLRGISGLVEHIAQRTVLAPDASRIGGMFTELNATGIPGLRGDNATRLLTGLDTGVSGMQGGSQAVYIDLIRRAARGRGQNLSFGQGLFEQEKGVSSEYFPDFVDSFKQMFGGYDSETQSLFLKNMMGGNVSLHQARDVLRNPQAFRGQLTGAESVGEIAGQVPGGLGTQLGKSETLLDATQKLANAFEDLADTVLVPITNLVRSSGAESVGHMNAIAGAIGRNDMNGAAGAMKDLLLSPSAANPLAMMAIPYGLNAAAGGIGGLLTGIGGAAAGGAVGGAAGALGRGAGAARAAGGAMIRGGAAAGGAIAGVIGAMAPGAAGVLAGLAPILAAGGAGVAVALGGVQLSGKWQDLLPREGDPGWGPYQAWIAQHNGGNPASNVMEVMQFWKEGMTNNINGYDFQPSIQPFLPGGAAPGGGSALGGIQRLGQGDVANFPNNPGMARDSGERGCSAATLTSILRGRGINVGLEEVYSTMLREGVISNRGLEDSLFQAFVKRHWNIDLQGGITTRSQIETALSRGNPVSLSVNGVRRADGSLASIPGGHIIGATGFNNNGMNIVDSSGANSTFMSWDDYAAQRRMPGFEFMGSSQGMDLGGAFDDIMGTMVPTSMRAGTGAAAPGGAGASLDLRGMPDAARRAEFLRRAMPMAQQVEAETGIPAAMIAAIAANESNYGNVPGQALMGIKASQEEIANGTAIPLETWETDPSQRVTEMFSPTGGTPLDALRRFPQFLEQNSRYHGALSDWRAGRLTREQFAQRINEAGYARNPSWAQNEIVPGMSNADNYRVPDEALPQSMDPSAIDALAQTTQRIELGFTPLEILVRQPDGSVDHYTTLPQVNDPFAGVVDYPQHAGLGNTPVGAG